MLKTIGDEVAFALKLHILLTREAGKPRLNPRLLDNFKGTGIEMLQELLVSFVRRLVVEQPVVQSHRGRQAVACGYPVNDALGFNAVLRVRAQCSRYRVRVNLHYLTGFVFDHRIGLDDVGIAQAYTLAENKTLVLLIGLLPEIFRVYI